jgi:hypothetical protein
VLLSVTRADWQVLPTGDKKKVVKYNVFEATTGGRINEQECNLTHCSVLHLI